MPTCTAGPIGTSHSAIYRARHPERTVLHRLLREHLETWLALARQGSTEVDPVPHFVETTFRKYLECGLLCYGFARVYCSGCGQNHLVAFSCRKRGLCPSCDTRRMVETAAHLTDHVIPRVPMRQRAVQTALRQASDGAPTGARFGAVVFVHRFGASLNSHCHFHILATDADLARVQAQVRRRILAYLARHDYLDEEAVATMLVWRHSGGFSLDGSVRLAAWDRQGLERLARYCARPSFAGAWLDRLGDETLAYRLGKPLVAEDPCLRDGSVAGAAHTGACGGAGDAASANALAGTTAEGV